MNGPATHGGGAHIALVGLGNIGSQTAALLSGIETVSDVLLIDPDRYEAANLGCQRIAPADVGEYKVSVQARALRRLSPRLRINAVAQPIESIPMGWVRGHVVLACVDSRIARQSINRRAFALDLPWVDAALGRDGEVRSRIYWPGAGDCLECSWSDQDYELLEQHAPCLATAAPGSRPHVKASAAPQELGAVAAGLQVSHLRQMLTRGCVEPFADGRQWFFDVASGRGWVGNYRANTACRLDHRPWHVIELARGASDLTLSEALRLPGSNGNDNALSLEGQVFVKRLHCLRCRASRRAAVRVLGRKRLRACGKCGAVMAASAADVTDVLTARTVPPSLSDAPLSVFGVVDGDIFSVRSQGATSHFQLCGQPKEIT